MQRNLSLTILLILVLIYCVAIYAQGPSASPNTISSPSSVASQVQPNDEAIALRAQLEIMRQYDQRLLETVYWALGAIGGTIALVVGLGWYTNFRLYKRDVADLERDLKSSIRKEMADLRREMSEETNRLAKSAVDSAMYNLKKMEYQMLKLEAEKWEQGGFGGNALYTYARMLEPAKSFLPTTNIPDILDEMLRLLKKGELGGLHGGHVSTITDALTNIPKEFSTDVDTIQQLIRSVRAK